MNRAATSPIPYKPDIKTFVNAMFRYADTESFISLRAFPQHDRGKPPSFIVPVPLSEGMDNLIDLAANGALRAATETPVAVFSPPVCTFKSAHPASMENLADGVAISVDIDNGDIGAARARIEGILGTPTVVTWSGGHLLDMDTCIIQQKVHLHWRLERPARTRAEHDMLRRTRHAAARIVGGDVTAASPCHPLRWPGSWHLKDPNNPALSGIIGGNVDNEVNLYDSMVRLVRCADVPADKMADELADVNAQLARGAIVWIEPEKGMRKTRTQGNRTPQFDGTVGGTPDDADDRQAPIERIVAALAVIPNEPKADGASTWPEWNRMGMVVYASSGGSQEGLDAWCAWSEKIGNLHSDSACADRWANCHPLPLGLDR